MVQVFDEELCMQACSIGSAWGHGVLGWDLCQFGFAAPKGMQLEQACLLGCWCLGGVLVGVNATLVWPQPHARALRRVVVQAPLVQHT